MKIERNFSLEHMNSFRLPIKTRMFVEYGNETELKQILLDDYFCQQRYLHIGRGSNLLFLNDFDGIVLHSAIKGITPVEETDDNVLIHVGAAELWDDVVTYAVDKGWGGIENLSLIPGETGAAAVQNIGAYGVEIKDVIETVEAFNRQTAEKRIFSKEACRYDYRTSLFKETLQDLYILTGVTLRLQKKPVFMLNYEDLRKILGSFESVTLRTVREAVINLRRQKLPDPDVLGNAGSFFMNPVVSHEKLTQLMKQYPAIPFFPFHGETVKLSAGWLIEQCGLKGKRFGSAGIHERHALVIVNYDGTTGHDISSLAAHIRDTVNRRFDVLLVPEVRFVGF